MKSRKKHAKDARNKWNPAPVKSRWKNLVLGGIAGAALLGGVGTGIYYGTRGNEGREQRKTLGDEFQGLEKYIASVERFGNGATKPTMYVIFQQHGIEGHGFSRQEEIKNWRETKESQLSVLKILQGIYKKSELEIVCAEGWYRDDFSDIENTHTFRSDLKKDYQIVIERESDEGLKELLFGEETNSGIIFPVVYPDVFLVGFEDKQRNERKGETRKEHELLMKNFEEAKEEFARLSEHRETASVEEVKQLRDNLEDIADKIKQLNYGEFVNRDRLSRTLDSIKYSQQHANNLYAQGLTKNKDVAIVIGNAHKQDYIEFVQSNKDFGYNMILITPKGIEKD